ncbi:MAG: RNA-directed DNA polymerase [Acidobacteria bacterium]|nr:RNA-directed DNA polymerase [Acidobacteriota bacterium]
MSTNSTATRRATSSGLPTPSPEGLATALAHSFLAAKSWTAQDLKQSAADILGARRRWLGPLVRGTLAAYHRRPDGASRELASFIATSEPFFEAVSRARKQRKPIRLAHYAILGPLPPRHAIANQPQKTGKIPSVSGLEGLATMLGLEMGELEWFADIGGWNRRATAGSGTAGFTRETGRRYRHSKFQHYSYIWRSREGRAPRLLEAPLPRLKTIQRAVLDTFLAPIPLHPAAHGFVPGRSVVTGAAKHTGSAVIISADLSTFFARVTAGKIYDALRQSGYSEAVAHRLTGICTNAIPASVLNAVPPGGAPEERHALRQALATPHLPQGAPSSPALANIAIRRLDSRLAGWASKMNATYTRYADDLTFSGGPELARRADAFMAGVGRIVKDQGHTLNHRKTRVRRAGVRQTVTGVVVNQHVNTTRRSYDILKATLHNCVRYGPESQNPDSQTSADNAHFRERLAGQIAWVASVNPARGAKLRAKFQQISW